MMDLIYVMIICIVSILLIARGCTWQQNNSCQVHSSLSQNEAEHEKEQHKD